MATNTLERPASDALMAPPSSSVTSPATSSSAAPAASTQPSSPAPSTDAPPDAITSVPPGFFGTIGAQLQASAASMPQDPDMPAGPNIPPALFQPPPQPKPYDPIKAWGSVAMLVAGIGSLLTRSHLTTALNAASDVMNAYKANDAAAANAAYQTWQASTANALKLYQFESEQYDKILAAAAVEGRTKAQADAATGAQIMAWSKAFKNPGAYQAYLTGGVQGFIDYTQKTRAGFAALANTSQDLDDFQNEMTAYDQLKKANPAPPPGSDSKTVTTYQTGMAAAAAKIFHKSLEKSGVDPADVPDNSGFSPNQYAQMAQDYLAGQKPLPFASGKRGNLQKQEFDAAVLAAQSASDGSGGANSGSGGLAPNTIQALGKMVALGDPISKVISGMGNASAAQRAEVYNAAVNYAISQGQDPAQMLMRAEADYASNKSALTAMTKMATTASGYEKTVMQNMKLTQSLQSAAVPSDISPLLNQIAQYGEVQAGSPAVLAYGAALTSTLAEYAKVMSGGTGSVAASSDSAREEAANLVRRFATGAQLNAVFAVMQQEMDNRMNGYQNSIDAINKAITFGNSATGDDAGGNTSGDDTSGQTMPNDNSDEGALNPAPSPGTVQDGYVFKGGDPSDANNWTKQ